MQNFIRVYDLHASVFCDAPRCDCVVALGNFDGVHSAHQILLHRAARLSNERAKNSPCCSAVWCFDPPSSDFLGKSQGHLTTLKEKLKSFADCDIDYVFLGSFPAFRSLSPDYFIDQILKQQARAVGVVCGYHFRFGKGGKGDTAVLQQAFGESKVDIIPPICMPADGQEIVISASAVRAALAKGDVECAARLLGHPYSLSAVVTHGKQLGRVLGFPTINQNAPSDKLLPLNGIYITRCRVDGMILHGVTNVGIRPTVDFTDATVNCETHILDANIDLYDKTVTVEFLSRLRNEQRFDSVNLLKTAVMHDVEQAKKYLTR